MKVHSQLRISIRRSFATCALLAAASCAFPAPNASASTEVSRLTKAINDTDLQARQQLAKARVGGVTVGIVAAGKLVWTRSYGMANVEKRIASKRDTVYRIGSITKQFVALMLLQLVETNRLRLSDPAEMYLPEIKGLADRVPNSPPITVVQLATHTAGLDREPDSDDFSTGAFSDWESKTLDAIPHTHFIRSPGSEFLYSNIGYAILGVTLSRAAQETFPEYVSKHILGPLGMRDTFFEVNSANRSRLAIGYEVNGSEIDASESQHQWDGRGYKVPPGGLFSTVDDLARFVSFEMADGPAGVLTNKSLEENLHRLLLLNDIDSAQGLGFEWRNFGTTIAMGHTGSVDGYQAAAFYSNKLRRGVIVLVNSRDRNFNINAILRAAFVSPPR
ncbi:MAG: serine hydrolase domain-containing protein [Rudaea sp.]